mmetsp:Transcript_56145/g.149844  ORF Transcript_56145/g.149844 Transcript_56145/m.149844 type:complete len:390 (-) Transcript_56145:462-1631(-)
MKRAVPAAWGGGPAKRIHSMQGMGFKLLLSEGAAGGMIGKGGGLIREIQQSTGVKIHLSGKGEFYPGTGLQEANVQSHSIESMNIALQHMTERATEIDQQDEAEKSMACVVPKVSASTVIGKGGSNVRLLQQNTGAKVHIEGAILGSGETAEQVIVLTGTLDSLVGAILQVCAFVQEVCQEPFFHQWLTMSLTCRGAMPAIQQFKGKGVGGPGKGKSGILKGSGKAFGVKGKKSAPELGAVIPPAPFDDGGYDFAKHEYAEDFQEGLHDLDHDHVDAYDVPNVGFDAPEETDDVLMAAAHTVMPHLPGIEAPLLCFAVPSGLVSAVIGKGGLIIKEISASTGAKIAIREIEGDPSQKSVQIKGSALSSAAAYLRVVGRMAELASGTAAE